MKANCIKIMTAASLAVTGTISPFKSDKTPGNQEKPNILILLADDQRADALGSAGNNYIRTPNIDVLARRGVSFSNCYIMGGHIGAISAPSRAMLLTGKSLFHVYDNLEGKTTLPMHLSKYGYQTFGTGKWHNTTKSFEASFQKGRNVFIGGMSDHFHIPCRDLGSDGKLTDTVKKGFSTDIFTGSAIDFINEYAEGERKNPFLCYVAFTVPHDPRSPKTDYIGMYPDGSIPVPGNFMKLHPFEYDKMDIRDETLAPWPRTPEIIQSSLSDYYALITHLDNDIGKIVESLKKNNLYENTIIVYAADNGLAIGSHGLLGKQNLYEHSMKVPLIICGPGIPSNKVSDAFVYLFDLFPTLCDIVNVPSPDGIDGRDIMPVISGKTDSGRKVIFTAYRNTVRAVRTPEWKFIRYPQRDFNQLFNLLKDPLEIRNLSGKQEFRDTEEAMLKLLKEQQVLYSDTISLTAKTILPLEYDYTKLKQIPDADQPAYIIRKYYKDYKPVLSK